MDHIKTLELDDKLVALEAFSLSGDGVRELVSKVLPSIVSAFSGFVGKFSPNDKPIAITSGQHRLADKINKQRYLDLAPMNVFVPAGLNTSYLDYAVVLKASVDHVVVVEDLLNKFTTFIALLIGNREQQLTSKNSVSEYLAFQDRREALISRQGACFKNGSQRTELTYSVALKRNSEWEEALGYANVLAEELNKVDRKKLNKKVAELAELLEKVIALYRKGELDKISPEVISEISSGTHQIAKELEFFAVTYYRVDAYVQSVNSSAENIVKVLKL